MNKQEINQAIELLKNGELVICPTETVYGIVADSQNPSAIKKLFKTKQRKADHALTVHIGDINEMDNWASEIPKKANELAKEYWPGPLTMILKKADNVSDLITAGKKTIGLRCPDHPIAQALIQGVGHGLIMSSANISGQAPTTTANDAKKQLGDHVKLIFDGGPCQEGGASTILDLTQEPPKILREGSLASIIAKQL